MSQQFNGELVVCGPFSGTSTFGITATNAYARAGLWTHAYFGVSVTSSMAGATSGVAVWGSIGGVSCKIAEVTGLMGLSRAILPQVEEWPGFTLGSTQTRGVGILQPRSVIVTGVSTGVGITFGCVVTANLFRP